MRLTTLLTTLLLALLPVLAPPPDVVPRPPDVVAPGSTGAVAPGPAGAVVLSAARRPVRVGPAAPRFGWPLPVPHPVVRPFTAPASPYGPGHRGVDLAGKVGAPVYAAGDGVVVFAGPVAGRGVVSVEHDGGLRTTYEPLVVHVTTGQRVAAGAVVGLLLPGHAGCAGVCLHWGARRGEEYLDPLVLLAEGRVRLLPWEGRVS